MLKNAVRATLLLPLFLLLACATRIPVKVLRPAGFDMSGIDTVVLLGIGSPGDPPSKIGIPDKKLEKTLQVIFDILYMLPWGNTTGNAAKIVRSRILESLVKSGRYIVVDAFSKGNYVPRPEDGMGTTAYVLGQVTDISSHDSWHTRTERDQKGVVTKVPVVTRYLTLRLEYRALNAKTGALLGIRRTERSVSDSSSGDKASDWVGSEESLAGDAAFRIIEDMEADLIPHESLLYLELEPSEENAPMKAAEELARRGSYAEARESYKRISPAAETPGALFNAALLLEALGDRKGAAEEMEALAAAGKNEKARIAAMRMRTDIEGERKARGMGIRRE